MKYYDEQLQELQQQLSRKKHLKALLKDLRAQQEDIEEKVAGLKEIRDKEQFDVGRLEGRGLVAFFYSVVGKKTKKLDKQRREAATASVKYDIAMQELDLVVRRIGKYENELSTLQGCEMKYAYTLKEKVKAIKATNNPVAEQVLQIEERIASLENQKKEIKEAISAGNKAKLIAEQVLSNLNDAEGWGTWDLLGGGLISDLAKHSSLDDAQEEIEHLQVQLRRFRTELADVTIRAEMQVNIDGFLRFVDCFFDGLFADWAVLDKIEESQTEVKKIIQQIQAVLDKLTSMFNDAINKQNEEQMDLDRITIEASI